jgi:NAD(P)-dependent dehydrogenase (short-subunit alcohol dehydrogenase family)
MQKLSGKTVLVTGGNSGIGLASARLFLEHGARVAITGQSLDSLGRAREELGGEVVAIRSDAGKLADIDRLFDEIGERFGHLDVLFVNAGNSRPLPFHLVTEAQFDEASAVLFKGAFFTIQKALPLLAKGASVIVTTSISNQKGSPNFSAYAACKAALRSLVQTLSLELVERGIRVNAISPGPIDTPGFGRYWGVAPEVVQVARDEFIRKSPLKRFGDADEVAKVALFLASEDSSYIVGTEIVVDGAVTLPL